MNKISGVVITYNREDVLELCLRSLRFVDELIVVDKSSTDGSSDIANLYADKVVCVPWSPTVEETRAYAIGLCSHEWIVSVDDDECLNLAAVNFIRDEAREPRFDIYEIPFRHYILGRHDERAYYWPEHRHAFFRRGAVGFTATVHGGVHLKSERILTLSPDDGPCIHHLSHRDTAAWIEKANRYTSGPDRRSGFADEDLASVGAFARKALDRWLATAKSPDNYLEAVAALRGVYDIIDGVKRWEALALGGTPPFAAIREQLEAEFASSDLIRRRPPPLAARPARSAADIERLHLYSFVRDFCHGLDVLEIGSGDGAGAAMLAESAQTVVGVGFDAVEWAEGGRCPKNLRFVRLAGERLPVEDASVDVVVALGPRGPVSESVLAEVRRALRPGGTLILERDGVEEAPEASLGRHFAYVAVFRQRAVIGSLIAGEAGSPLRVYGPQGQTRAADAAAPSRVIVLASDTPSPVTAGSILEARQTADEALLGYRMSRAIEAQTRESDRLRDCVLAASERERRASAAETNAAKAALAGAERRALAAENLADEARRRAIDAESLADEARRRALDAEARQAEAERRAVETARNETSLREATQAALIAAEARSADLRAQLDIARVGWIKIVRMKTRRIRRAVFGGTRRPG